MNRSLKLTSVVLASWCALHSTIALADPAAPPAASQATSAKNQVPLLVDPATGRPRVVSPTSVAYLERMRQGKPFGSDGLDLDRLRKIMGRRNEPTIAGVALSRVKVGEVPCEWVAASGADPDVRLLYIHGGGFVSGSGGFYLPLASRISAAAKCVVLLVDYRLAPEHPFPAGLDDCVAAHTWLVDHGPPGPSSAKRAKATFIAGDSAGGNLTLATLLALKERKLALPNGAIPISPCTDFLLKSDSLTTAADPVLTSSTMPWFRKMYLPKEADYANPLASPAYGRYTEMPPLLIQLGEHEILRDDGIRAAAAAKRDGATVRLEVWPGMFHVFQSREPLLPEAKEAINHIADFIQTTLTKQ